MPEEPNKAYIVSPSTLRSRSNYIKSAWEDNSVVELRALKLALAGLETTFNFSLVIPSFEQDFK